MSYTIEMQGLTELRKAFAQAPELIGKELGEATKNAGAKILGIEKDEVPIDTGALRRSVEMEYKPISVKVYPSVEYALYVHDGTKQKDGKIYAIPASSMSPKARARFIGAGHKPSKKGMFVFRGRAGHGAKENKFVERTVKLASGEVSKIFEAVLDKAINILKQ